MTWNERVHVVMAMHRHAQTCQVLAVFTDPDDAQAFCDAHPRWYYRRSNTFQVRDEEARAERALGWRPCLAGHNAYVGSKYEVEELEIFITDRPWNPPIATWPPTNPPAVWNSITLEEPGGPPLEAVGWSDKRDEDAPIAVRQGPIRPGDLSPAGGLRNGWFFCRCDAAHARGPINGFDVYRCLSCGATTTIDMSSGDAIEPITGNYGSDGSGGW